MKKQISIARKVIYENIKADILSSRINEGEKLIEQELAEKYNYSRTPVREALLMLQQEGYITINRNKGAVVKKLSIQKVKIIFETLAILEGKVLEKLNSDNMSSQHFEYQNTLQKKMEVAAINKEYDQYMDLNFKFHQFFVERFENECIRQITYDLRQQVYRIVRQGLSLPQHISSYLEDHNNILEAIAKHNFYQAGYIMESHVMSAGQNIYRTMTQS